MTAENLLNENYFHLILDSKNTDIYVSCIENAMKEYAKNKCQELLEIVAEKAKSVPNPEYLQYNWIVDKNSILKAVDLNEFIK